MAEVDRIGALLKGSGTRSGTQFVRLTWCDTANIIRAKAVHVKNFEGLVKDGVSLCTAVEVSHGLL